MLSLTSLPPPGSEANMHVDRHQPRAKLNRSANESNSDVAALSGLFLSLRMRPALNAWEPRTTWKKCIVMNGVGTRPTFHVRWLRLCPPGGEMRAGNESVDAANESAFGTAVQVRDIAGYGTRQRLRRGKASTDCIAKARQGA